VQCERLNLSGDPVGLAQELRELIPAPEAVADQVTEIIARVRASGDDALRFYTREYDTGGTTPAALRVPEAELDTAEVRLDEAVRAGLQLAIDNVTKVAEAGLACDQTVSFDGHEVLLREVPVDSAAVYVPGGRAPYPSTVIMGVVTARVAGVQNIAVCAPPGADGEVNSAVLGACRLAGASVVYRMGGAQAIAALAFGTETVSAVDVIVGPGNLYVQEAKRQVFGRVGIDGFAGPSDLMVIADGAADPGPLGLAEQVSDQPDSEAVVRFVGVGELEQALAIADSFAPEHLQLVGPDAEALAPRVRHSGCVFVGSASGTAFGDYIAGSNHVLPTNGAARFASALSAMHFRRRYTEVRIGSDAATLARAAAPIARAEGFELHARSLEARIRDNDA
jgi:histidinol dehydrogenase